MRGSSTAARYAASITATFTGPTGTPGLAAGSVHAARVVVTSDPEDGAVLAPYLDAEGRALMTGQTLYIDGGASLNKYPELSKFFGGG